MKQQTHFNNSMGNCATCFKVPPPDEAQTCGSPEKDKETEITEVQRFIHAQDGNARRHSLATFEPQINGNSRTVISNEHFGSLNREKSLLNFCSRMQTSLKATASTTSATATTTTLPTPTTPTPTVTTTITTAAATITTTSTTTTTTTPTSVPVATTPVNTNNNNNNNNNNNETKVKEISESKLIALYDTYKDLDSPDYILAEGIERLLSDLNLSPDEFKVLVLAWKLKAETMCQFSKEEFMNGFKSMHVDSVKSISSKLPEICKEVLNNPDLFKDLYRFTFRFGLDKSAGQRILPSDMAICLWKIVFSMKEYPILEKWLNFLECHPSIRGIPGDTWNMFLNLVETVGNDLSSYDDSEAWPSVFDDFVEYENDKANQNISKEKDCI